MTCGLCQSAEGGVSSGFPPEALCRAIEGCLLVAGCLEHELTPGHPPWTASLEAASLHYGGMARFIDRWLAWCEVRRLGSALGTRDLPEAIEACVAAADRLRPRLEPGAPPSTASIVEGLRFFGGDPEGPFNLWMAWRAIEGLRPFRAASSEPPIGAPA